MVKRRLFYLFAVLITVVLLFFFSKTFFLCVLIAELLLPLVIFVLLKIDVPAVNIKCSANKTSVCGTDVTLVFELDKKHSLFAADSAEIQAKLTNIMFDESRETHITLPLSRGKYTSAFGTSFFGEVRVEFKRVSIRDIFGFFEIKLSGIQNLSVTVLPEEAEIFVDTRFDTAVSVDSSDGGKSKIGNDPSEVFDLREYSDGDDTRSVHWKISSKLDHLYVKEASDFSHYDTLIFLDIGKELKGSKLNKKMLSCAASAASTISERLLDINLPHTFAFYHSDKIEYSEVFDRSSRTRSLTSLLSFPLNAQNSAGLPYFLASRQQRDFNNIIYVTVEKFPDRINELSLSKNVTALLISSDEKATAASESGSLKMITVPYKQIDEGQAFKLYI